MQGSIGLYHLSINMMLMNKRLYGLLLLTLFAAACAPSPNILHSTQELTPTEIPGEVPLFPGAIEQDPIGPGKLYVVSNAKILTVAEFYEDRMPAVGWELLANIDTSTATTGESRSLIFQKGGVIVQIDVFTKDAVTLMVISAANL